MLSSVLSYVRRPFEYAGILAELEPEMSELEEKLVKRLNDFFKQDAEVYKERKGFVTQISSNSIELSHRWTYKLVGDNENFSLGDLVSWKEYQTGTGVVIKDVVLFADKGNVKTKNVTDKIVGVEGAEFKTQSGIVFYLNKVSCDVDYRPEVSDSVKLECTYFEDENSFEDFDPDPSHLQVKRVSPGSAKLISGEITSWDPSTFSGVIHGSARSKVLFHQDACHQLTPFVGAAVSCDCVGGKYEGGYGLRAYKVVKRSQVASQQGHFFIVDVVPKFIVVLGETKTVELKVSNKAADRRPCRIRSVEFLFGTKNVDVRHDINVPYQLPAETSASWNVDIEGVKLGSHRLTLKWHLDRKKFPVTTNLFYTTVQQNLEESESNPCPDRRRHTLCIPAPRTVRNPTYRRVVLQEHPVPERLRQICSDDSGQDLIEKQIALNQERPYLAELLSPQNYADHMHTLLHLEEIAEEKSYTRLAVRGVLSRSRDFITFDFPADSDYVKVVCGDRVLASKPWETIKYESNVWGISSTQLQLKFSDSFEMPSKAQFDLEFRMNRRPHQRRHQAVDLVLKTLKADWLFPVELDPIRDTNTFEDIRWFNPELNFEQKTAVTSIMRKNNLPYPYVIYGPPGTGKTVTVVESILQVIRHQKDYRILVTAPTNSAVDTLGLRLLEFDAFDKSEMVRLSSYNAYSSGQIAVQLMDIARVPRLGDPAFDSPLSKDSENVNYLYMDDILNFRIAIGTLTTISYLNCVGLPKGFFTHIIIDEAGQCHEPETLIPIALAEPNRTQIVLAGDPQQLGPTIDSHLAKQYSFDMSFLDRLTRTYLYKKKVDDFKETHGYNPLLITKLVSNYRSLPRIVNVVGSIFYGGDLRPTILEYDSREGDILQRITIHGVALKESMESMIFINVNTPEEQTDGSHSWMNHGEVAQVFYVLNFLYSVKVSPDDIGVITPYALQKKKIYEYLDAVGAHSPKVASVEEFQGQERDVIICSLVRNNLGITKRLSSFVTDPHRVNVALSRARVLNIIIGNKTTLMVDPLWAQIISKCRIMNFVSFPDPD